MILRNKAGVLVGLIFAVVSAIRYYLLYPDIDRLIVYTLVGLLMAGIFYLKDKITQLDIKVDSLEQWVQDKYRQSVRNKDGETTTLE